MRSIRLSASISDPSHLFAMGAEPDCFLPCALKGAIHHVHGKDARIECGLCDVNGLLETKPVTDCENRTLELCRSRLWQGSAMVERILLGLPHGRL